MQPQNLIQLHNTELLSRETEQTHNRVDGQLRSEGNDKFGESTPAINHCCLTWVLPPGRVYTACLKLPSEVSPARDSDALKFWVLMLFDEKQSPQVAMTLSLSVLVSAIGWYFSIIACRPGTVKSLPEDTHGGVTEPAGT